MRISYKNLFIRSITMILATYAIYMGLDIAAIIFFLMSFVKDPAKMAEKILNQIIKK